MPSSDKGLRVIIVGGGIAGLTLANILQYSNIDFLLLERRDVIDPQIGASIGIMPNENRILDQLGCFDAIDELVETIDAVSEHWADGQKIGPSKELGAQVERSFGYGFCFLDRRAVWKILYDHIHDKSKVLLNKHVARVENAKDSVIVHTKDGESYHGDLVVGCDGIRSKVREERWRIAAPRLPQAVLERERNAITAEYRCLFGISNAVESFAEGEGYNTYTKDRSIMSNVGKGGRVYWFCFEKYPRRLQNDEIPRYSDEEAVAFAEKFVHYAVGPQVKFRDLWEQRQTYALVGLEEAAFEIWSDERIALVGDCVHKMTPNAGQGGNAAIDYTLSRKCCHQAKRTPRIKPIMKSANYATRMQALKGPREVALIKYVQPVLKDSFANSMRHNFVSAERVNFLPLTQRSASGTTTFNPSQGPGQEESKATRALKALPIFLLFTLTISTILKGDISLAMFKPFFESGKIIWDGGSVAVMSKFYGIKVVDMIFAPMVVAFAQ
ncbi:FAD/NAD(P)-binding domain-containing protein [Tothia fuscella]|uniref:FAD/NAD(P)-binding domain-containing protein n=1 Tax=Tothia fuscella TaxID=1048955 RepID=A0A9P4TVN7_9PEZI|nr:FAD/NAD(P)-binding domain-containing protein [Tothia fuscella]